MGGVHPDDVAAPAIANVDWIASPTAHTPMQTVARPAGPSIMIGLTAHRDLWIWSGVAVNFVRDVDSDKVLRHRAIAVNTGYDSPHSERIPKLIARHLQPVPVECV